MALFGGKKKEKKTVSTSEAKVVALDAAHGVLKDPRITEKASIVTEKGAYVFNVYPSATKYEIKRAVQAVYKVVPVKVNVINNPSVKAHSRVRHTQRKKRGSTRKAYVYLKKGDTIELV